MSINDDKNSWLYWLTIVALSILIGVVTAHVTAEELTRFEGVLP